MEPADCRPHVSVVWCPLLLCRDEQNLQIRSSGKQGLCPSASWAAEVILKTREELSRGGTSQPFWFIRNSQCMGVVQRPSLISQQEMHSCALSGVSVASGA
jgi:hypothetical protein